MTVNRGLPIHLTRLPLAEGRQVLSPAMLSFMEESKRLINRRMRDEWGVRPRYPDLAHGLPDCLAASPKA